MKKRSMMPFYIILVPVVLVTILLNSGLPQRYLTAVRLGDERYTAAQYNYYYHRAYNAFLESGSEALETLGYDPLQKPQKQQYDETTTWQEHLSAQAQERFVWVAYHNQLADEAGFPDGEACLPAYEAWLAEATAFYETSGIGSLQNYLTAYYGAGMTEQDFRGQFLREERAEAYYTALHESAEPTAAEVDAWTDEHAAPAYRTANLHLMVLDAQPDRYTGEVGEDQRADLTEKLRRLSQRAQQEGASFESLVADYCDDEALRGDGGRLEEATEELLPDAVAAWCLEDEATPGEWLLGVDETTNQGYLAQFDGYGREAGDLMALEDLQTQQLYAAYEQAAAEFSLVFPLPGRWLAQ